MDNNREFSFATVRTVVATGIFILLLAAPQLAMASKGSSHGGRSDDPGSHGHGSDDSGKSGSSSHGGGGDDDRKSGQDDNKNDGKEDRQRSYEGGWRARISNGRYEVFDPAGRLVIRRNVRKSDYDKF